MELTTIYKGGVELKCAPDQLETVKADGWSTEKPVVKVAPKPIVKPTPKTESVKKDSGNDSGS